MRQVQTISREVVIDPSETTRRAPFATRQIAKAYLFGAMHDGWIRKHDNRYRIAQKDKRWLEVIQNILINHDYKSWIYKEGKKREVYILESVAPIFREPFDPKALERTEEIKAYIRGFFDAEGGIPSDYRSKRYIQLVQKDKEKIMLIVDKLNRLNIPTGKLHNPSKKVDPDYWRVFVRMPAIPLFVSKIGSWHPRKAAIFQEWVKI